MSLLKPNSINGLNTTHVLHANLKSFVEFGVTDKDLVSDIGFETTAPTVTDADFGQCREFSSGSQSPNITLPLITGDTIVIVKRFTGDHLDGGNSRLYFVASEGGDTFRFQQTGFGSNQYSLRLRSGFGDTYNRNFTPYTDGVLPESAAETLFIPVSLEAPYSIQINDVLLTDDGTTQGTATDFSSIPFNVPMLTEFGGSAVANVAAIILLDRELTAQEITDIHSDPWALLDGETTGSITPTQPPQGGEIFSFSGSNYSAQPTGPMTFTQDTRTISRAVTISNWDAADGSFTGVTDTALPGVPAAGASDTPALLYGEPVTISLPDPGA